MNGKAKLLVCLVLPMMLALGALALFAGCRRDKPTAATQGTTPMKHAVTSPAAQRTKQTNCPVMGGPINPDIFTEYQGEKVYFCCQGCDQKFRADPGKYLSKLPQFQK